MRTREKRIKYHQYILDWEKKEDKIREERREFHYYVLV
jgi:hypothetical protein